MSNLQAAVQAAIDELIDSGDEIGLQVAVYEDGELVVDAVAGVADTETGAKVEPDALIFSTSTGKGLTSTVAHVLVEQGRLDYDTPIADVWPEFGVRGKEKATLRHVLTHTVGLPGLPPDTDPADLADWDKICAALAASEPWWEPGTKLGYHAITFGYLVGEIVRRATGRGISDVLRDEVAAPLGVANELFFAVPESELGRVARLEERGEPLTAEQLEQFEAAMPLFFEATPMAVMPSAELYNRHDFRTADVPAGATVSARAIARMYAALLGEVDGVRLLPSARVREVTAVAVEDTDVLVGGPSKGALGYAFGSPAGSETAFGWPGVGGSWAGADLTTGRAYAVTTNHFTNGDTATAAKLGALIESCAI